MARMLGTNWGGATVLLVCLFGCSDAKSQAIATPKIEPVAPGLQPQATGEDGGALQVDGDVITRNVKAFWEVVEIEGEWAEYFPTLSELSQGSDCVVLAEFVSAVHSNTIQGDAKEDVVHDAHLELRVLETLHGQPPEGNRMLLMVVLPRGSTLEKMRTEVATLNANAPTEPMLVFGRLRASGDYRVVNGDGLWASTSRHPVDTPLNTYPPTSGIYASEIARMSTMEDFVSFIKTGP